MSRRKILKDSNNESQIKNDIQSLEEDIKNIYSLFTDLSNEIHKEDENFVLISDYIDNIKNDIKISNEEIKEANEIVIDSTYSKIGVIGSTIFGMGIGSIATIYSPYLAIGTIISGGFLGYFISSKVNENLKNLEEMEKEYKVEKD